jgi:hypothetical protein
MVISIRPAGTFPGRRIRRILAAAAANSSWRAFCSYQITGPEGGLEMSIIGWTPKRRQVTLMLAASVLSASWAGAGLAANSAESYLRIESQRPSAVNAVCRETSSVRNRHEFCFVIVTVQKTVRLTFGNYTQSFTVPVPPSSSRSLGCSWTSGGIDRSPYRIVDAEFGVCLTQEPPAKEDDAPGHKRHRGERRPVR